MGCRDSREMRLQLPVAADYLALESVPYLCRQAGIVEALFLQLHQLFDQESNPCSVPLHLASTLESREMPPPTARDAWPTGRHVGVVIDAGSSGSRVQI